MERTRVVFGGILLLFLLWVIPLPLLAADSLPEALQAYCEDEIQASFSQVDLYHSVVLHDFENNGELNVLSFQLTGPIEESGGQRTGSCTLYSMENGKGRQSAYTYQVRENMAEIVYISKKGPVIIEFWQDLSLQGFTVLERAERALIPHLFTMDKGTGRWKYNGEFLEERQFRLYKGMYGYGAAEKILYVDDGIDRTAYDFLYASGPIADDMAQFFERRDSVEVEAEISTALFFNGNPVAFEKESIALDGYIYCPLAELLHMLDGSYTVDEENNLVLCFYQNKKFEFPLPDKESGSGVDGLYFHKEDLYIPLIPAAEAFNLNVTEGDGEIRVYERERIISTAALDDLMKKYGNSVSVYFEDIGSGFSYGYRENKVYFAASVIKAPYVLYVYELAAQGQCDLGEKLRYEDRHYAEGTGRIKEMAVGTVFDLQELLTYAIRYSDNVAMRMLMDRFGIVGFTEYVSARGISPDRIKTVRGADTTARESGLYAAMLYDFMEREDTFGQQLKADLLSTSNPMIIAAYPIARKYGWAEKSFHDMAVVYGPSPYILVILTEREDGTAADFALFRQISREIEDFVSENFWYINGADDL